MVFAENEVISSTGSTIGSSSSASSDSSASSVSSASFASSASSTSPSPTPTPLTIVISEVMWMGSTVSTADEWVEIAAYQSVNDGPSTPRSLSGWTLTVQKDTGEAVIARLNQSLVIGSGGYLVVSNYSKEASRLDSDPAMTSTAMSLPNTKLQLRLRDAQGILIDEVDDYIGAPFAGANPSGGTKASMERVDLRIAGTISTNWRTATVSKGFDEGVPIFGTPGFENGAFTTLSSSSSMPSSVSSSSASSDSSASSESSVIIDLNSSSSIPLQPLLKLKINELIPNPKGSDDGEWIEIKNTGSGAANLSGMTLRTGTTAHKIRSGTGFIIEPGSFSVIPKSIGGFSLVNNGTTVRLESGSTVFDTFAYGLVPEGISVGRNEADVILPFCVPTPGLENQVIPPDPKIVLESGKLSGLAPVTMNLGVQMGTGSLTGASCQFDFGDGFTVSSCNPSSHTMRTSGNFIVTLQLTDYCSNTVVRTLSGSVITPTNFSDKKSDSEGLTCKPTAFSGALITEIFPNPSGDEKDGEWIEILNPGPQPLPLCGWSLDDEIGGSKPYSISDFQIPPLSSVIFARKDTNLTLNNDHDMVRLIAPLPAGGTGVSMSVFFDNAPEDESYAIDGSGSWLWTQYVTPGTVNRFQDLTNAFEHSPISLSAALPNPKGEDTWDEWVELTNSAGWPIWLNGWVIRNSQGKELDLTGTVLSKVQTKRIYLAKPKYVLGNSAETLYLIDQNNVVRSILSWKSAKDDAVQKLFVEEEKPITALVRQVIDEKTLVIEREGVEEVESEKIVIAGLAGAENNFESKDFVRALLLNKKVELQFDSSSKIKNSSGAYVFLEKENIAQKLLTKGLAYADRTDNISRLNEYIAYEHLAKSVRAGIWRNTDDLALYEAKIADIERWKDIQENGLTIKADVKDGLVASGTVVQITPSAESQVYVSINSGAYVSFTGSIVLTSNQTVKMFAQADFMDDTLDPLRSDVVTRTYIVQAEPQSREILVSEVYPSPDTKKSEQEWVELYNPTSEDVSLAGWLLDDTASGGSLPWRMPIDTVIPAQGYLVFSKDVTKISFNNSNDDVTLLAADGSLIDSMHYGTVKTSRAVARNLETGEICLTDTVTLGTMNTCFIQSKISTRKSSSKSGTKSKSTVKKISKAEQARIDYERTASGIYAGLNAQVSSTQNLNFESLKPSKTVGLTAGITICCAIAVYGAWVVMKRK